MKLPTTRDYKTAIVFLFLGFIASSIVFFVHNAHEIWYWHVHNDLGKLEVGIVKMEEDIINGNKFVEGWDHFKAEVEEALEIIFTKPEEAK